MRVVVAVVGPAYSIVAAINVQITVAVAMAILTYGIAFICCCVLQCHGIVGDGPGSGSSVVTLQILTVRKVAQLERCSVYRLNIP